MRAASIALLALVIACGGGSGKGPNSGGQDGKGQGHDDSIAELAAKQGGLLGGGGSGYDSGISGSFKADLIDSKNPLKMDGMLRDWPARAPARTTVSGSANGTSFGCALQYDDGHLYFAGEVTSSSALVRTARFGEDEDHASLVLAFPGTGSLSATEIAFYAGIPGQSSGAVRYASGPQRGRDVAGAKIVEAPADKGYTFEASFPWSAFAEARTTRVGLRGVGRYYDAQGSKGIKAVLATGQGDVQHPAELAALPNEAEQSLIENLLTQKGLLATSPKADVYADINGDGMKERIAVFDHLLTITGSGYRGGKEFFYRDLGADLVRLDARDLTGRGKEDLLIRRRFSGGSEREWLEVWSFFSDEPTTTFSHEIAITSGDKQIVNAARLSVKEIEVTYEPAKNWDPTTYREPTANDVEPVLLPWGAIKSQTYKFDGTKFTKAKEVSQTATGPAAPVATVTQVVRPPEPATPPVRTATDLAKALLDRYKADRGVPAATRPKVDLEVNVDGDTRAERVSLIGKDIVVFGPGFKNGTAYAYITLSQFADDADITEMTARDLTGDGAADLIVRGVRHVSAAGQGQIDMDVMFVYQVKSESITRVFSIETGREQTGKRVQGLVQFIPSGDGKKFDVDVRPGRATGWTEATFPWGQEQPGSGATEPLLLPWGKIDHVRYAWNGSTFARVP